MAHWNMQAMWTTASGVSSRRPASFLGQGPPPPLSTDATRVRPICITFWRDELGRADLLREPLRAWPGAAPPRAQVHDENGEIHVPVLLAVAVEKDRVVVDAVRQIRELDEVVRLSGLPPLRGEAPTET